MDKYPKAVLAVVALSIFALSVKAEEKVWYCQMTEAIEIRDGKLEKYKLQKFKIKVTPSKAFFGSGGYFDNAQKEMTSFVLLNSLIDFLPALTNLPRMGITPYVLLSHMFATSLAADFPSVINKAHSLERFVPANLASDKSSTFT